mmetsp:Transcript_43272/g.136711  ORF Transcript_43272/g.136711 Transcript_43272/m.136711 type:complete len:212 (+) Transcript_43272:763-1398(+)
MRRPLILYRPLLQKRQVGANEPEGHRQHASKGQPRQNDKDLLPPPLMRLQPAIWKEEGSGVLGGQVSLHLRSHALHQVLSVAPHQDAVDRLNNLCLPVCDRGIFGALDCWRLCSRAAVLTGDALGRSPGRRHHIARRRGCRASSPTGAAATAHLHKEAYSLLQAATSHLQILLSLIRTPSREGDEVGDLLIGAHLDHAAVRGPQRRARLEG